MANPHALAAPDNQKLLARLRSYWFFALFQQVNGTMHPAMLPLAWRAWAGLFSSLLATFAAYLLGYRRTLRKIIEEPEIVPAFRRLQWAPGIGSSVEAGVLGFSARTLLRSRQHRLMLAFYVGSGLALVIVLLRAGVGQAQPFTTKAGPQLLFSSLVLLSVWVVGTRVVFSVPVSLRANWIFRITQVHEARRYFRALRLPLILIGVAPAWLAAAVFFLWI